MLVSLVPAFTPGFLSPVSAAGYPTALNVSLTTNYGNAVYQGFPYQLNINVTEVNSTGGLVVVNSSIFVNITYVYANGTSVQVYHTPLPGFQVINGKAKIAINSTLSPGYVSALYRKVPQNVTKIIVTAYDSVYGPSNTTNVVSNVPFKYIAYPITGSPYLQYFEQGFMENLEIVGTYGFGNTNISIYAPNGTLVYQGTYDFSSSNSYTIIHNLVFTQAGYVKVVFNNSAYNGSYVTSIPVKPWTLGGTTYPKSLVQGRTTNLSVAVWADIRISTYNRLESVELVLPNGTVINDTMQIGTTWGYSYYYSNPAYYG
ncbi:MAG: hypothetical protein GXO14_05595, partial [Thermococci archaeon]|nr:hypothetical protein [Thermococci archaeon]